MESKPSFISLAIWEHAYDKEAASFDAILVRKAKYLQALKGIDLFDMPEAEAVKMSKQIDFLTGEITSQYSFKLFADNMRTEYMETLDKMYDFFTKENYCLSRDLKYLTTDHEALTHIYQKTVESLEFISGLLRNQIEKQIKSQHG